MMTKLCVYQKLWLRLKMELSGHFILFAHQSFWGETKKTERRPRERLLKESCELQPLPPITTVNHLCCAVGRKGQGRPNTRLGASISSVQGATECGHSPQNQATNVKCAAELHPKCLAPSTLLCTVLQSRSSGQSETNYFLVDKCISVGWSSIQHLSPKHLESYYNPCDLFLFLSGVIHQTDTDNSN